MGLSSNVLWHQTNRESLVKILKTRSFKYSYSLEKIKLNESREIEMAFPMLSMCNLPLSDFGEYLDKYGGYSIGLDLEWGKINGLCPVWYCNEYSYAYKSIVNCLNEIGKKRTDIDSTQLTHKLTDYDIKQNIDSHWDVVRTLMYIKIIEGELKKHSYDKYRFMDEKEYRVCLSDLNYSKGLDDYEFFLAKDEYEAYKFTYGSSLLEEAISFQLSDIRFVIVKDEQEAIDMRDWFLEQNSKSNVHVFTHKEILEDFEGINHFVHNDKEIKNLDKNEIDLLMDTSAENTLIKDIVRGVKANIPLGVLLHEELFT
ncbi:MAG: hypothetical protein HDS98_01165 [Bacteroidales bacterium]|nr:hypothetical protein [Bacteroidales bacterium]